jgi:hypothetical protein
MLRLKGEPDDSMADGVGDDAASDEFDESLREHPAFATGALPRGQNVDDGFEDDSDRDGHWSSLGDLRGLAIAAATFVPTFLIVFVGLPYLVADPSLARTPGMSSTVASAPAPKSGFGWSLSNSLSEALRGGPLDRPLGPLTQPSVTVPAPPPVASSTPVPTPPAAPATPSTPEAPAAPAPATPPPPKASSLDAPTRSETAAVPGDHARGREQGGEPMPGTTANVSSRSSKADSGGAVSGSTPSLPPAPSRVPEPERKAATASKSVLEPRSVPAPRQAAATPDPRRLSGDWTPAAAFADREAAVRLASSIERQGYPVEIRQESSTTRPWVVWIGSQPSGGRRR